MCKKDDSSYSMNDVATYPCPARIAENRGLPPIVKGDGCSSEASDHACAERAGGFSSGDTSPIR